MSFPDLSVPEVVSAATDYWPRTEEGYFEKTLAANAGGSIYLSKPDNSVDFSVSFSVSADGRLGRVLDRDINSTQSAMRLPSPENFMGSILQGKIPEFDLGVSKVDLRTLLSRPKATTHDQAA